MTINEHLQTYALMARTIFHDTHGYGPAVYDLRAWQFARQAWHRFAVAEAVEEARTGVRTPLRAALAACAEFFAAVYFNVHSRIGYDEFAAAWQQERGAWAVENLDDVALSDTAPEQPASTENSAPALFRDPLYGYSQN